MTAANAERRTDGEQELSLDRVRAMAMGMAKATEVYATIVAGDCMEPAIAQGACVVVDPLAVIETGDLIVLVKRPELICGGEPPGVLKRLVGQIDLARIPYVQTDADELEPCLMIEMDNPRRRMMVPYSKVAAVQLCVGIAKLSPDGRSAELPEFDPRPRRASLSGTNLLL